MVNNDSGVGAQAASLANFLWYLRSPEGIRLDVESFTQFMAFAIPLARISSAQLYQDIWALWEARGRRGGYFVEFGAMDGRAHSNTYMLETVMQWWGLVAEPNPRYIDDLRENRKCLVSPMCVWKESGSTIDFIATEAGALGRVLDVVPLDNHESSGARKGSVIKVPTITLHDLLVSVSAPRTIDYMSIDTEGSEYEILSAFDFDRWDIRTISIEHNFTPIREQLHELMLKNGYRRKWPEFSNFDDWYVRVTH